MLKKVYDIKVIVIDDLAEQTTKECFFLDEGGSFASYPSEEKILEAIQYYEDKGI